MQLESKIRHRLKLLRLRYLEKAIRKVISRRPENCLYNNLTDTGSPIPVRICTNPNPGFCGAVCDESYGGANIAARCNQFDSRISAETAKAEFHRFLLEASTEELAQRYPDIMALLWVLGDHVSRNFGELENELLEYSVADPIASPLADPVADPVYTSVDTPVYTSVDTPVADLTGVPEIEDSYSLDFSGNDLRISVSLSLPEFVYVESGDGGSNDDFPNNPLVMMYYSNAEAEE